VDPIDPAYIERIWSDSIPQLPRAERLNRSQPQQQPEQYPQDESGERRQGEQGEEDEDFYEPSSEPEADAAALASDDGYDPNWRAGQLTSSEPTAMEPRPQRDRRAPPSDDDDGHAHIDITV
jgi:hypothetical protein